MTVLIFAKTLSVARGIERALVDQGRDVVVDAHTDISDMRSVIRRADEVGVTAVVHAAGVDEGEVIDPDLAFSLNAESAIHVAAASMKHKALAVLLSTSVVFGRRGGPFSEDDPQAPSSVISESRSRGETLFLRTSRRTLVLRTGLVLSDGLEREARRLESRGSENQELVSPVAAYDVGLALHALIQAGQSGVFHVAPMELPVSRLDLARAISQVLGREGTVKAEPMAKASLLPPISGEKLAKTFPSLVIRGWRRAVNDLGRAPRPESSAPQAAVAASLESSAPQAAVAASLESSAPQAAVAASSESLAPQAVVAASSESSASQAVVAAPSEASASQAPVAASSESLAPQAPIAASSESLASQAPVAAPPDVLELRTLVDRPSHCVRCVSLDRGRGLRISATQYERSFVLGRGKVLLEIGDEDHVLRPMGARTVSAGVEVSVHAVEPSELFEVS
ncbi:MAG: sugar nucleotide-binding protein [Deltaproteobacteria bacterium]|nr:sugar nucleotide-binding protein [Deltaproteobacteria bacterium]